jgi:hypothetical protein
MNAPLSPSALSANPQQVQQAVLDRQALAQDIFNRLILITGAAVQYPYSAGNRSFSLGFVPNGMGTNGIFDGIKASNQAQYNALRWLAQLSANIVDYIDSDDISTAFVWNPTDPTNPTGQQFSNTSMGDRVVFGVERPRVLLNEAYSEMVNDPSDTGGNATKDFQVRFWAELLNAGTTLTNGGPLGSGAQSDGSVQLHYPMGPGVATAYSPYVVEVFNTTKGPAILGSLLGDPTNVTGDTGSNTSGQGPMPTDIHVDFQNSSTTNPPYVLPTNNGLNTPNNPTTGFLVIGPQTGGTTPGAAEQGQTYQPDKTGATTLPYAIAVPDPGTPTPNRMFYTVTKTAQGNVTGALPQNNLVILRRLANPYLQPNDPLGPTYNVNPPLAAYNPNLPLNPYITVDYVTGITAGDGVRVGTDSNGVNRTQPSMQAANRQSVARMQPMYGSTGVTATPFTQQSIGNNQVYNTFFFHNINNIVGNFDWFTHLDRKLVNPIELLHVSSVMPHELTYRFNYIDNSSGAPVAVKFGHTADWFGQSITNAGTTTVLSNPLYRALEAFSVKPWTHGVPWGGRTPGKVNVNMIWDARVLQALLDPQSANTFTSANVYNQATPTDPATYWGRLFVGTNLESRTKSFPNVNLTQDESATQNDANADRPFKGIGTGFYSQVATSALPNGTGLDDTILRRPLNANGTPSSNQPILFNTAGTHPYMQLEPLRKLFNNVTTVSDTFMVFFTIGFFEVRAEISENGITRVILGKEIGRDTPGDLRVQYAAIVDRTQLGVTNLNALNNATPPDQSSLPMVFGEFAESYPNLALPQPQTQIKVVADADQNGNAGIYYDGQFVPFSTGQKLRLGVGDYASGAGDGETVTIASATYNTGDNTPTMGVPGGVALVTLAAAPAQMHAAGSLVSAVKNTDPAIPGNPGPRTDFDFQSSKYRGVVPFVVRMPTP